MAPSALPNSNRLIENISLALCGLFALAFAVVMPPLQVPDEEGHFIRAYAVSRGEFVGPAIPELPGPVISFVTRYPEEAEYFHRFTLQEIVRDIPASRAVEPTRGAGLSDDDGHHKFLVPAVVGSSLYYPLVYLPAGLGIWIARSLHTSPLLMMYVARIFNVLTFVAALAISIRLAPGCRALMTAVALMPMTLQQAGGISADLATIGFSFVGLSMVLYTRDHLVSRRFLMLLAVVFVQWGLCKSSIWALPLLWLIPASVFKSRRTWLAYIGATSICIVGALLIWNATTSSNLEAFRAVRLTRGVDIAANVRLVAAHPFAFARHLFALGSSHVGTELGQMVGAFGWTKFSLPAWVKALYLLLLVFVAATERSTKPFLGWERGVLLLAFCAGFVVVHVVLAISDTTLCEGTLGRVCLEYRTGVQGRYLIPFCLAGLLALQQCRVTVSRVILLPLVTAAGSLHAAASLALIRAVLYQR